MKEACPLLLKIDVEGFETEVVKGVDTTLSNKSLKEIIIELNDSGQRYVNDEELIHNKLLEHGFKPFNYNPKTRQLIKLEKFGTQNTIYLRDIEYVEERLKSARQIKFVSHGQLM